MPDLAFTYRRLVEFLRAELAFFPGRGSLILRITCACTLSMVLLMVFRIPGGALGAYYPLLLTHDTPRSTLRAAGRIGTICFFGTAEIIFGAMLLMADPFMHLLWVTGNLLLAFFLIRTLESYDAALAFGLLLSNAITIWDLPASADFRLTHTLYSLLSILIGCAVTVTVEYLFAWTHHPDAVVDGICARLTVVSDLLLTLADGDQPAPSTRSTLSRYALRGTGDLRERLAHADYHELYKDQLSAALALSGRLTELAAHLTEPGFQSTTADTVLCRSVAGTLQQIELHLQQQEVPEWSDFFEDEEHPHALLHPLLVEIERTADLLAESFNTDPDDRLPFAHLPAPGEGRRRNLFVPDLFTNHEHFHFAIRGTVTAMACYLAYMSVGWTGLNASIATCILTALPNTGATRHKQLMRFSGMLVGACVLGVFAQAVVLPQMDSIQSFAILFATVVGLGAWVSTSSPRLSHAGAQLVLAFAIVNVNFFAINPSLVPARDAISGILLGIFAMWLIYDHLWTKSTPASVRELLLNGIRGVAALKIDETSDQLSRRELSLWSDGERLTRLFDRLRNLVDYAVFEVHARAEDEVLIEWIRDLQPQLRLLMMVKSGLLHHRLLSDAPVSLLIDQVWTRSNELLEESAALLEDGVPALLPSRASSDRILLHALEQLQSHARTEGSFELATELRLCSSLLHLALQVRDRARHWRGEPIPPPEVALAAHA